ncbi:MAG TPA: FN3 domain-containing metallophosphoesterase family protein [Candidatus Sumerlaeota bacterium]|nr:FN3 domain-containing metallophosphoesterase family protein [Candidatus Sumerlaeota bacterium]
MMMKMNRWYFRAVLAIWMVGWISGGAVFQVSGAEPASPASSPLTLLAGPYVQAPLGGSATILWIADRPSHGWVEYGASETLGKTAFAIEDGLKSANEKIQKVTLSDLKPGETVYYRVVTREIVKFEPYKVTFGSTLESPIHHFKMLDPNAEKISFLVFNDIHENVDLFRKLLEKAGPEPYDLVFFDGDILSDLESEDQLINHFLKPVSDAFAGDIPFFYIRGNHETRGAFARQFKNYLANPEGRFYYTFDCGPAQIVALDSGEDKEDANPAYSGLVDFDAYRGVERDWLAGVIQTPAFRKAPFRITLSHMPMMFQGKEWHGTEDARTKWAPLLEKGRNDILLSGHTHQAEIRPADAKTQPYPILIGGAPKVGKATVMRVEVTQETLKARMIGDDGKEQGPVELRAPHPGVGRFFWN